MGREVAVLISLAFACASGAANADWRYDKQLDRLTGKSQLIAELESINELSLGFPYAGRNHGTIYIVQHPMHGLRVAFAIERGQLLCQVDGCSIKVRFDDKLTTFSADQPADHRTTALIIDNAKRFLDLAKKARRILVSAMIYQHGAPVLEFHSAEPLKWPPPKLP